MILINFRAKFVREVYTGMEQELHLIGVTGIEDRLQEQVVQTIRDLRVARIKVWIIYLYNDLSRHMTMFTGLDNNNNNNNNNNTKHNNNNKKVWMLTGDKKETAINLGYSAGLLTQDRTLIG